MTFLISALFAFSAPAAVFAWLVTPKENAARSGTRVRAARARDGQRPCRARSGGFRLAGAPGPATTSTAATPPARAAEYAGASWLPPRTRVVGYYGAAARAASHVRRRRWRARGSRYGRHRVGMRGDASLMKSAGAGGRGCFGEHHRHLLERAVALAEVAGRARGDDVLPDGVAAAALAGRRDRASAGRRSCRSRRTPSRRARRGRAARCAAAPPAARGRTSRAERRAARGTLPPPSATGRSSASTSSALCL